MCSGCSFEGTCKNSVILSNNSIIFEYVNALFCIFIFPIMCSGCSFKGTCKNHNETWTEGCFTYHCSADKNSWRYTLVQPGTYVRARVFVCVFVFIVVNTLC